MQVVANQRFSNVMRPGPQDIAAILGILSEYPEGCIPMTSEEVHSHLDTFRVIRDQRGRVVATISMQFLDRDTVELRGVAVARSMRGCGLAGKLVQTSLAEISDCHLTVVCATKEPGFFARFGFTVSTSFSLPRKKRSTQACTRKRVTMVLSSNLQQEQRRKFA